MRFGEICSRKRGGAQPVDRIAYPIGDAFGQGLCMGISARASVASRQVSQGRGTCVLCAENVIRVTQPGVVTGEILSRGAKARLPMGNGGRPATFKDGVVHRLF